MSRQHVVVIDADEGRSRSGLAAVRLLGRAGHRVVLGIPTIGLDRARSLSARSRWVADLVALPPTLEPRFRESVDGVRHRFDDPPLLVTSDRALLALDLAPRRLIAKDEVTAAADRLGIPTPATRLAVDATGLRAAVNAMGGRAIVKPTVSLVRARWVTSDEAGTIESGSELFAHGPVVVQEPVDGALTAVGGLMHGGELVAVVHQRAIRTFPVATGPSSKAVTTDPDASLEASLVALIDGHEGIFQAQFVGGRLIDLNLRAYGSLPLAAAAGLNLPDMFARLQGGRAIPGERPLRARPGVSYRWLDGDLRALTTALRHQGERRRTLCEFLPRRGTVHSIVDLSDPDPVLARIRQLVERR